MKRCKSLPKAISFALGFAMFFVGAAVADAANSALIVTCDERADVPEDDGFATFLDRLNADGWRRYRIPEANDPTHKNVVAVIDTFVSGIEDGSDAIVALKGRVVETEGVVYFLPVDAKTADDAIDESNAIPLEDVVGKLEKTPAKRCFLAIDDRDGSGTVADESFQRLATPKVVVIRGKLGDVFDRINGDQSPQDGVDQVPNSEETESKDVGAENQADVDGCFSDEPIFPPQCADSANVDNNLTVKVVDDTIRLSSSCVLKEIANEVAEEYGHDRFVVVPTFVASQEKRLDDSLLPLAERLARDLDEELSVVGFSTAADFDEIQAILAKNEISMAPSPSDDDFEKMTSAIHDVTGETVDMVAYGRLELVANDDVDGVAVTVTVFDSSSKRKKAYRGVFKADALVKAELVGLSTTISDDDTEDGEYSLEMPFWSDLDQAETKQDVEALTKPAMLDPEFDYHVSILVRDTGVDNAEWEPREIVQDGVENVLFLSESETFQIRVKNKSDHDICARIIVDGKGSLPLNGQSGDFAPLVKEVMDERSWLVKSRGAGFVDGFYRLEKGKLEIGETADTDAASFKLANRTDADVEYYETYPEKAGTVFVAVYDSVRTRDNDINNVAIIPDMSNVTHRKINVTNKIPKGNAPIAVLNVRVKLPPED